MSTSSIHLIKILEEECEAFELENSPDKFRKLIRSILDQRVEVVIKQYLGFSKRWGNWDVDNCNGRAGNSFIGRALREKTQSHVDTWVEEQLPDIIALLDNTMQEVVIHYTETHLVQITRTMVRKAIEEKIIDHLKMALRDIPLETALKLNKSLSS